ncbi:MAG: RnfABCDGE type electron transport complex subunit A [Oscillospiraceae bacterium]|nr:RnfABCDGE type electron transport complex subunit A [Oscillospiraceae bacterium]
MREIAAILVSAILVDNFVLSRFLGICPFLGVSKKFENAVGMGVAVTFVMVCSSLMTHPIYNLLLAPFGLGYLRTISFIIVIALFVQLVEMALKKKIPSLYKGLGVYLPLMATNCAVLGVTILNIDAGYSLLKSAIHALGGGLGFTLALIIFSCVRSRIEEAVVPPMFKGVPATLIAASIVSVSFMGFAGLFS